MVCVVYMYIWYLCLCMLSVHIVYVTVYLRMVRGMYVCGMCVKCVVCMYGVFGVHVGMHGVCMCLCVCSMHMSVHMHISLHIHAKAKVGPQVSSSVTLCPIALGQGPSLSWKLSVQLG